MIRRSIEALEARTHLSTSKIQWNGQAVDVVEGQWLVRLGGYKGSSTQQLAKFRKHLKTTNLGAKQQLGANGMFLVQAPTPMPSATALARLQRVSGFVYAEPNFIYSLQTMPNDPSFGDQWGMNNTGQSSGQLDADIDAIEAWNIATGSSEVVVAVVDSGMDYTHPDLAGALWTNQLEIDGNGIDDDNNGYIDDVHGWDFYGNGSVNGTDDNDVMDQISHGTHVAGIIGAQGNNSAGVAGVNWNVKILPLKIGGATTSINGADGVLAVNYVTAMRQRGVNVRVVNHSWGGFNFNQMMQDAMNNAANAGIIQVCAAGNYGGSTNFYPAAYSGDHIISVGATNRFELNTPSSNFSTNWVDLGAPGEEVLSTVMGNGYDYKTGTSMAAPHVSGAIALALSLNPDATIAQIRSKLFSTVDVFSQYNSYWATSGRLNLNRFLQSMLPPPSIPTVADLISSSDTGPFNNDNVTFDTTPTLTGAGSPGSTIHLLDGVTEIATTMVEANGAWTITTPALSDGVHSLATFATNQAGTSQSSSALEVTIDTIHPTFTFVFSVSPEQSLEIGWDEPEMYGLISESDFVLIRLSDQTEVSNNVKFLEVIDTTHLRLHFSTILPDGQYELRVVDSLATDLAGNGSVAMVVNTANTPSSKLFVLPGDLDHDGDVDFNDMLKIAQRYNQSGQTYADGNADYSEDGRVTFSDLLIVAQNYGTLAITSSNQSEESSQTVGGSVLSSI